MGIYIHVSIVTFTCVRFVIPPTIACIATCVSLCCSFISSKNIADSFDKWCRWSSELV